MQARRNKLKKDLKNPLVEKNSFSKNCHGVNRLCFLVKNIIFLLSYFLAKYPPAFGEHILKHFPV